MIKADMIKAATHSRRGFCGFENYFIKLIEDIRLLFLSKAYILII